MMAENKGRRLTSKRRFTDENKRVRKFVLTVKECVPPEGAERHHGGGYHGDFLLWTSQIATSSAFRPSLHTDLEVTSVT